MPPSRRLQTGAVLFALVLALSIWIAPSPFWVWRALAGLGTGVLGWWPMRTLIFQKGRAAVRQFEWAGDGRWFVSASDGDRIPVQLHPATAAIGPWILLVWTAAPADRRHRYALIDAACVTRKGFRALRGRLKLSHRAPSAG